MLIDRAEHEIDMAARVQTEWPMRPPSARLHAHKSARQELTAIAAAALILLDLFQMG
jgi:hypothetical protein